MSAQRHDELPDDQLSVLRIVVRMDLSHGVAISQSLGRPAYESLAMLRAEGYVKEIPCPRRDGSPNQLYTITAKGREAVKSQLHPSVGATAVTTGPKPAVRHETYSGFEMRPFTGRAGSTDALKYPSRIGDQRHYRDDARALDDENAKLHQSKPVKRR